MNKQCLYGGRRSERERAWKTWLGRSVVTAVLPGLEGEDPTSPPASATEGVGDGRGDKETDTDLSALPHEGSGAINSRQTDSNSHELLRHFEP